MLLAESWVALGAHYASCVKPSCFVEIFCQETEREVKITLIVCSRARQHAHLPFPSISSFMCSSVCLHCLHVKVVTTGNKLILALFSSMFILAVNTILNHNYTFYNGQISEIETIISLLLQNCNSCYCILIFFHWMEDGTLCFAVRTCWSAEVCCLMEIK